MEELNQIPPNNIVSDSNLLKTSMKTKCNLPDWDAGYFPPEKEEGNVEYKLKLLNPTRSRLEHLVTQMKWRLQEGQGEAIYTVGVEDGGFCTGLTDDEMKATMDTLETMANRLGAALTVLRKRDFDCDAVGTRKQVAEVLVRRVPDDQQFLDIRVSVVGNADAGKSTLLGVLTQGHLDNGRGQARLNLFRHLHEIQTGRTSCISHEILGFDSKGKVLNYGEYKSAEDICSASSKIITFTDLAGHHKYLSTTVFGLTSHNPDFAVLVVSANRGIAGTTREHLGLAMALDVPIVAVVTKIDLCPKASCERSCRQLEQLLFSPVCGRIPFRVRCEDDVYTAAAHMARERSKVVPLFKVSSVKGTNLSLLTRFFNVLPPQKNVREQETLMQKPAEFQVDEVYTVPDVGSVVGGTLLHGTISEEDRLLVGPTSQGLYFLVTVTTIQRNRAPCRIVRAGQAASLSLDNVDKNDIRKGMVMVSEELQPGCCIKFDADVFLLYHSTNALSEGFQSTVHVGNVRQTTTLLTIDNEEKCLNRNEQANVTFRFACYPEYLRTGSTLLFREQTTKGIGQVTKVYPYNPSDCGPPKRHRKSRGSMSSLKNNTSSGLLEKGISSVPLDSDSSDPPSPTNEPIARKRQHIER